MIHERSQNVIDYIKIGLIILRHHVYDYGICKIDGDNLTIFGQICNENFDFKEYSEENINALYKNIISII